MTGKHRSPYQDHLLDRVVYAQPRSIERRRPWALLLALLAAGTIVGGCVGLSYVSMVNSKAPLETMARGLAAGLIQPGTPVDAYLDPGAQGLSERVAAQRSALTEAGVDWSSATAIGFGGCMATVKPKRERSTAAAIGWLYVKSNDRVYGIELSAREVDSDLRVTEIWKSEAIAQTPAIHSQQAFETFVRETPAAGEDMAITSTRYVYLPL